MKPISHLPEIEAERGNVSNPIVRVSVSSSSVSSRSNVPGQAYQRTTYHNQPPAPTPPSIHFQPTTYHPQLSHLFTTFHRQRPQFDFHHQPLPFPHQFRHGSNYFIRHPSPVRQVQPQLDRSSEDIFSAFYRTFSRHHSAEQFPLPVYPTISPPEQLVSIVSQTQSVSEATTAEIPKRLKKPRSRSQLRLYDQKSEKIRRKEDEEEVEDESMYQSDQPYDSQESIPDSVPPTLSTPESWEEPEKVWGKVEKNWEEPEKVWSSPEAKWEVTEAWEGRKSLDNTSTPPSFSDEMAEDPARFYELGEDEEDEPKELILDSDSMQASIEAAQLAARRWELPVLHQTSLLPTQSYVRTSAEGMAAESLSIPYQNGEMPNVRMTLEDGGAKAKVTSHNLDTRSPNIETSSSGKRFGYVLNGSKLKKYRVEERTPDGFIVGEYGVLNQNNGMLRGVRYTADGTINPRLIHEALMKFLSL